MNNLIHADKQHLNSYDSHGKILYLIYSNLNIKTFNSQSNSSVFIFNYCLKATYINYLKFVLIKMYLTMLL